MIYPPGLLPKRHQSPDTAPAVVDVGPVHLDGHEESEGVNNDVFLAALYPLAAVPASLCVNVVGSRSWSQLCKGSGWHPCWRTSASGRGVRSPGSPTRRQAAICGNSNTLSATRRNRGGAYATGIRSCRDRIWR